MNAWRDKLLVYRERFRHADRRWHFLVGSQLLFVVAVARFRLAEKKKEERIQSPDQANSSKSVTSSTETNVGGK